MVREYKEVQKDDEFKALVKDDAVRSDKLAKENEAHQRWQERLKNNWFVLRER